MDSRSEQLNASASTVGSPLSGADAADLDTTEDFAALFEASMAGMSPGLQEGEQVRGRVVKISNDFAFVDLGGKSEGQISLHEFKDPDGNVVLNVGDTVEATVVGSASDEGAVRLSKSFGKGPRAKEMAKEMLFEAYQNRLAVEGKVVGRNKGGYEVTVAGLRCFVPLSQIDRYKSIDPDVHVGQTYQFRIMEFREGGRNILLSRAQLQRDEAEARARVLRESLREGDVVTGKVRSIQAFGAFIDLGGLDGLLPISELSWTRVKDVKEVLNEGDTVSVQVLKFDKATDKLSFSLKALASNPWEEVGVRFVEGGIYRGKVMRIEPFGAFVSLQPGLEGLLHISDLAWDRKVRHPKDVLSPDDEVTVQLLSIDFEKRRLRLGMKQLGGDPWDGIQERFVPGKLVEGTVEKVAPFGVFLTLEPGVTGLVPNSEMNTARGSDHGSQFPVGSVVQVQVLDCNPVERRITLSRKAMQDADSKADFQQYKGKPKEAQNTGNLGTVGSGFAALLASVKVKPADAAAKASPKARVEAPALVTASKAATAGATAAATSASTTAEKESAPAAVTASAAETVGTEAAAAVSNAPAEAAAAEPVRESRRILVRGKL